VRVLAVDVGTGTQDILLFDSEQTVENSLKMIMPSPTVIVASEIQEATARGEDVLLEGVTMGGGPCAWAADEHLRRGYHVYATPAAARTFNDDLEEVARTGVRIVAEGEAAHLDGVRRIRLRDFDFGAITRALDQFKVAPRLDAVAVAVFDHGAAPPGVSDRLFRFDYLAEVARSGDLTAFAHPRFDIPARLTRMQAVADSFDHDLPLLVMDTGPAAVIGALEDERVRGADSALVVNIGNFHTLAFHMVAGRVAGLFEHHTGMLSREKLEDYLRRLGEGTLRNEDVFADSGHGAMLVPGPRPAPELVAVTGPRRGLLYGSALRPYFAAPHGDMMVAGCFGLLRATAATMPAFAAAVEARLAGEPWCLPVRNSP